MCFLFEHVDRDAFEHLQLELKAVGMNILMTQAIPTASTALTDHLAQV